MTTTNPSLADLLQHFTSPNNDIRHEAEKYYNSLLQTSPDEVVIGLMQIMANEQIPFHIRQLSSILLRRCLIDEEDSYYFKLQLQSRHYVINEISRLLLQEQNTAIRIKITDIAGELGGSILEPKDWPNLYPTMIQLCNSGNPADREVGLSLLGLLAASAISSYDDFLPTASQVLLFNFQQNSQEGKGLTLTIRALNDVVSSVKLTTQLEVLQSLVPPLFQSISSLLEQTISIISSNPLSHPSSPLPNNSLQFNNNNGNTNIGKQNLQALCNCFETLIDIADHSSIYFQPYLQMIVFPLLDYLETSHLTFKLFTFGFHSLILEYLVTLSIHETKKIKKCKGPNNEKEYFITRILPICLQYMAILPKENHWETADTVEEIHYDSSYHDIGEAAFRRCISVFGIKSTYTIISTLLSHYLTSNDWEKVYAGLQCLSGYVEITVNISNPSQLLLHRKEVTQTIHHFITNAPHPRVRYNAFYALSQFILFHGNELTTSVLQDFIQLIGQHTRQAANSSPRIRRNALIALIQLIDISSASFVSQHVSYLLEIICSALQEGPTIVQESCVSAIISIAETSRGNTELWNHYYPLIMPILKQLFSFSQKKSLESLWCQTLECISVLGESAGKSLFYEDACDLMNLLTSIQSTLQQHSSLESTLLKAWVRLGRCLGSEFLPYLPSIMEKLFEALSQDIIANPQELENRRNKGGDDDDDLDLDMDDEGGDEEDEDNEFQTIETANGWVTVRTSAVEEQSSSLQMILLLTEKLQEYYYPYIEQTISHLTKLLASPNEDIRSYSIVILPELIRSIGKALPSNRNPLKELTFFSLGKLIDLLEKESSLELIMTALQAIKQILLFACADWSDVLSHKEISVVPAITPTTFSNGMGEGTNANGASNNAAANSVGTNENLAAQGEGSEKKQWLKLLDDSQMLIITKSLKSILRESLQRRAVLKAEKQLEEREESHQPPQTKASDDIHNKDTFEVEDVFNEEEMFFQQSLELHYNISEVINILFQTHSLSYLPIYYQEFHELIINFTNFFCLREDQRFAFLMISDVVEFGLNPTYTSSSTAVQPVASPVHTPTVPSQQQSVITSAQQRDMILSYLQQLFPILHAHCQHATNSVNATPSSSSKSKNRRRRAGSDEDATDDMNDDQSGQPDYELLRTIVYIIGIIFEHYSIPEFCVLLNQYLTPSLLSLHQIMSMILTAEMNNPQDDAKERSSDIEVVGMCKDNIISAIGMIAQKIFNGFPLSLLFPNNNASTNNSGNGEHYLGENIIQIKQLEYLLNQWLQLLPLEFDQEENVKVMKQLLQFLYGHKSFAYLLQHVEMFHNAVTILIKEIELNRLSKSLIFQFHGILFEIFHKHQWQHQSIPQDVLNVSLQSFSPEQQLALQNILFAYPNLAQQQQQQQLQQQTNGVSESQQIAYHDVSTPIRINHSNSTTSPVLATSPLATAPIHDVLINMK